MNTNQTTKLWSGVMFIILGLILLLEQFFPELNFEDFWPVLLIITGAIMIYSGVNPEKIDISDKMDHETTVEDI